MRHNKAMRKFIRVASHREAMIRNLATSLFLHERIRTTVPKAKDLRRVAERLITLAGEDNVARRRQAYGYLYKKDVVHKLFAEIGPRFLARPGGYTRITRVDVRPGDRAEMAIIELVTEPYKPTTKKEPASSAKGNSKREEKVAEGSDQGAMAQSAATVEASES